MSHEYRRLLVPAVTALLSACAAAPSIEYRRIDNASQLTGDEFDTFSFQRSVIKIDSKKDSKGGPATPLDLVVTSVPTETSDFKVALRRADRIGVRTSLNITKFENTDLVKEIGTEVIDTRVDLVNKIGGILVKLAPVAFQVEKGVLAGTLPLRIDVQVIMANQKVQEDAASDVATGDGVTIDFGPIPKDARPIREFPNGQAVGAFYYAACRTALVKVGLEGKRYEQTVKVSDPRFFQSVGLPVKGKVTMHSECGASVSADKDTGVKSSADIVDALVAQGKAIKDAIDAAKKDGK